MRPITLVVQRLKKMSSMLKAVKLLMEDNRMIHRVRHVKAQSCAINHL